MFSFWGLIRAAHIEDESEQPSLPKVTAQVVEEEDDEYIKEVRRQRRALMARNENLQERLRQIESILSELPPVWIADADRSECFACGSAFSFFNRRHHCRACGEIFDSKCTTQSKNLPSYPGGGPQKVCDSCFKGSTQFNFEDLDSSALVALGFGGIELDEPITIESPKRVRRTIPASQNIASQVTTTEPVPSSQSVKGRRRSEIPPAPPFPTVISRMTVPAVASIVPKVSVKKDKPKVAVPANVKRIDFDELQTGIARLRKAPRTPSKVKVELEKTAISELRQSLRRRRRALEDSVLLSPIPSPAASPEPTPAKVFQDENAPPPSSIKSSKTAPSSSVLLDSFRETLALRDVAIPNANINTSWLGDD